MLRTGDRVATGALSLQPSSEGGARAQKASGACAACMHFRSVAPGTDPHQLLTPPPTVLIARTPARSKHQQIAGNELYRYALQPTRARAHIRRSRLQWPPRAPRGQHPRPPCCGDHTLQAARKIRCMNFQAPRFRRISKSFPALRECGFDTIPGPAQISCARA